VAITEAVRGPLSNSANSPKKSPRSDYEEAIAIPSLRDDDFTRGALALDKELPQGVQLPTPQIGEERDLLDDLSNFLVTAHRVLQMMQNTHSALLCGLLMPTLYVARTETITVSAKPHATMELL